MLEEARIHRGIGREATIMYQKKRKFTKSEREFKPCKTLIERRGTQEFVTHREDE